MCQKQPFKGWREISGFPIQQGGCCPSGSDPAPCPRRSPSVRSRTTWNWRNLSTTFCRPTLPASPSCPTTVALKEICRPSPRPRHRHLWKAAVRVTHGSSAKGKRSVLYLNHQRQINRNGNQSDNIEIHFHGRFHGHSDGCSDYAEPVASLTFYVFIISFFYNRLERSYFQ